MNLVIDFGQTGSGVEYRGRLDGLRTLSNCGSPPFICITSSKYFQMNIASALERAEDAIIQAGRSLETVSRQVKLCRPASNETLERHGCTPKKLSITFGSDVMLSRTN